MMIDANSRIQTQVDEAVRQLSSTQAVYFALACCERMELHYATYAVVKKSADSTFARAILNHLWETVAISAGALESSKERIAEIDCIMPNPETDDSIFVWPAIYCLEGIKYLFQFAEDKDLTRIQQISHLVLEIIRGYVITFGFPTDGKFVPPWLSNQAYVWADASPASIVELTHQHKILESIVAVGNWSEIDVNNLRRLAQIAIYNPQLAEFHRMV